MYRALLTPSSHATCGNQVESATTVKGADNVDIGCGNAFGGEDEAVDDSVEKVVLGWLWVLRTPMK